MTNELTRERVEKLRAALEGTPDQQGFHAAAWLLRAICDSWLTHEPLEHLEDMTIGDCIQVGGTVFPAGTRASVVLGRIRLRSLAERIADVEGASRDASSEVVPRLNPAEYGPQVVDCSCAICEHYRKQFSDQGTPLDEYWTPERRAALAASAESHKYQPTSPDDSDCMVCGMYYLRCPGLRTP